MEKKALLTAAFISVFLLSAVAGTHFVNLGRGNPYFHDAEFKEVTPPVGIEPPIISILTPENSTVYNSSDVSLTFNVTLKRTNDKSLHRLDRVYYNSSWQSNVNDVNITRYILADNKLTSKYSIKIEMIPEGPQWLEVYAVGVGSYSTGSEIKGQTRITYFDSYKLVGSSIVNFTIDTTPPRVSILSVENKTYDNPDVTLTFTVSESTSKISYTLDGQENVTVVGNTTLTGLSNGGHNITVYATDFAEHTSASETIYFSVEEAKSFPTTLVIAPVASVAFVGAGLLVYFKKHKRETGDEE